MIEKEKSGALQDYKSLLEHQKYADQIDAVCTIAADCIGCAFPGKFDVDGLIVEKKSYYDDDWYLWIVAARYNDLRDEYAVWTLNLTTLSLNDGSYNVRKPGLSKAIAGRKHAL